MARYPTLAVLSRFAAAEIVAVRLCFSLFTVTLTFRCNHTSRAGDRRPLGGVLRTEMVCKQPFRLVDGCSLRGQVCAFCVPARRVCACVGD